jgi:hypothetical protein
VAAPRGIEGARDFTGEDDLLPRLARMRRERRGEERLTR